MPQKPGSWISSNVPENMKPGYEAPFRGGLDRWMDPADVELPPFNRAPGFPLPQPSPAPVEADAILREALLWMLARGQNAGGGYAQDQQKIKQIPAVDVLLKDSFRK